MRKYHVARMTFNGKWYLYTSTVMQQFNLKWAAAAHSCRSVVGLNHRQKSQLFAKRELKSHRGEEKRKRKEKKKKKKRKEKAKEEEGKVEDEGKKVYSILLPSSYLCGVS